MNSTSKILREIAKRSNGKMKVKKVPKEKQPSAETLARLDAKIKAQINANNAMRYRSYINSENEV